LQGWYLVRTLHKIFCPVDQSDTSGRALDYALMLGAWYGASVEVVEIVWLPVPPVAGVGLQHPRRSVTTRQRSTDCAMTWSTSTFSIVLSSEDHAMMFGWEIAP